MSTAAPALDDPSSLAAADRGGMLGLVAALGPQLREGYRTAVATEHLPEGQGLRHVVVCGMGGSGVAGDILSGLYAARLGIPIVVVKGYALPEFCGRDTLVLAVSYSGNTEETLTAYAEAKDRGCRIVAVSAGGELAALAREDPVAHVPIPPDVPVPRAALGYLASAPIGILEAMGILPPAGREVEKAARMLEDLAERLGPSRSTEDNPAKSLAGWLHGRTPVVWGSEGAAGAAALRWKTQLNENAKTPAFAALLPELDHNDIEGWSPGAGGPFALVVLRHPGEHPRIGARVSATLEAIAGSGLEAREVRAEGNSTLQWLTSLIIVGDFVATYLAFLRRVDPTPIPVLLGLKERLRR
jgi:glucose/mannose-6-phosphate isomerase